MSRYRTRDRARAVQPWQYGFKADGIDPTFAMQFDRQRFAANGASKPFSDVLTLTRSSTKWVYNPSGLLTSVAANLPAYDYDPVTGAAKGILVEESRENKATYSVPTTGNWGGFDATNTYNSADTTSPDGTTTSAKVTIGTGAANHNVQGASASFVSGTTYTLSCYLKAGTTSRAQLSGFSTAFGTAQYANFLLTGDGSVTAVSGGAATIQKCGNGWYRVSLTVAATATVAAGSLVVPFIQTGTDTRNQNFTGNGTDTFYIWGAQVEVGSFPTSYIPTTSASVTRTADVIVNNSATPVPFADWYNQVEGTVLVNFSRVYQGTTGFPPIFDINDSTSNEYIQSYINEGSSNVVSGKVVDGGVTQMDVALGQSYTLGTSAKFTIAYKLNNCAKTLNGLTVVTDTSATIPTVTRLCVGANQAISSFFNGHISELRYYPARISNSELQRITTL